MSVISFEQPSDPWTHLDFCLLKAYEQLQSFICPECGGWVWICSDEIRDKNRHVSHNHRFVRCEKTKQLLELKDGRKPSDQRAKVSEKSDWGLWTKCLSEVDRVYAGSGLEMPEFEDYRDYLSED